MALTERSRSALYLGLSGVVEEEAVQEMLSYFPARDVEEPVTRELLQIQVGVLRADVSDLRTELKGDIAEVRTEIADLRTELKGDLSALEIRLGDRIDDRLKAAFALTIGANVATVVTVAAVIFAAIKL